MKSSKYPISYALTSFNNSAEAPSKTPVVDPGIKSPAKIHRLPSSNWKKMEGTSDNPLD